LLADLEPWLFVELYAYYRLEPFGDDWTQTANIEAAIRQANGQEVHPSELIPNEDNREQNGEPDAAQVRAGFMGMAGF
jgi:hypothetical protein